MWPVSRHYTEKPAAHLRHYSLERYRYTDIDFTDAALELEVTLKSDFTLWYGPNGLVP